MFADIEVMGDEDKARPSFVAFQDLTPAWGEKCAVEVW
jgi:hypothetical protein